MVSNAYVLTTFLYIFEESCNVNGVWVNVLKHDFGNTRPNTCGSTGFEEGFITHAATERLQTHIPHVIKSSSFSHADWIRMADIAASL